MNCTNSHPSKRGRTSRALSVLLAAAAWLGAGLIAPAPSRADVHTVDVKIKDIAALTETALPIFIDNDCYGQDRAAIADMITRFGQLPDDDEEDIEERIDEACHTRVIDVPLSIGGRPWGGQFYGREWSASVRVKLHVPVEDDTLTASFGNAGRVNTDFDLDDAEATVTLELVGERLPGVGNWVLHPTQQTIHYSVSAVVGGLHGSADVSLAVSGDTLEIAQIHSDSIELGFDRDGIEFDFDSNNVLVEWLDVGEVFDVIVDIGAAVYGLASGDCRNTEDCLIAIFEQIVVEDEDFFSLESPNVVAKLTDALNGALSTPVALDQQIDAGEFQADVGVSLSGLTSSAARNDLTVSWAIDLDSQNAASCATGLTGHSAPAAGVPSANPADLQLVVPYSLIADAAENTLKQVDFCKAVNFGGFSGRVQPNGAVAVARIGSSLTLTLPMKVTALASGSTGTFQFSARITVLPSLDEYANIVLAMQSVTIVGLTGSITIPNGTTIDIATGQVKKGGVTVHTGTDFATPIADAVNDALDDHDLPTFVQYASPYFIPHAYLKPARIDIDSGSFTFGMNVKDGTQSADIAVARIEAAGPYTERTVGPTKYRDVPLRAIVLNKLDEIAPPVDLAITDGTSNTLQWIPELAPGAEYAVPYTVTVRLNANGTVQNPPTVKFSADPGEIAIFDENRANDEKQIVVNDDWFRPDYRVEITGVTPFLLMASPVSGGSGGTEPIDSIRLTVTAVIRNIGGASPAPLSLSSTRSYVNNDEYETELVGPIASGAEHIVTFEIDVDEGPNPFYCDYDIEIESNVASDRNIANDNAFATLTVNDLACHGSPDVENFDAEVFDLYDLGNGENNVALEGRPAILDRLDP